MTEREVVVATSARADGNMGFSAELDKSEAFQNREKFLRYLGLDSSKLIYGKQTHGSRITVIRSMPPRLPIAENDGFVTDMPGVALAIFHADCLPVFFYTKDSRAIGIAHAGWRGIIKGIVPRAVQVFKKTYRIKPDSILARLGPAVQACHFEIKDDVLSEFGSYKKFILRRGGKIFVDLAGIVVDQLVKTGIKGINITDTGECTFHLPQLYFSYRREKSKKYPNGRGNMLSCIAIQNETKAAR